MDISKNISQAVVEGNEDKVKQMVDDALNNGNDPADILNNGLLPGMDIVGERMKSEEMFIPEVLMSARSMQGGLDLLLPRMSDSGMNTLGTVVIGTVEGDLHDIGKNLVCMMLEGAGFRVVDLGINVTPSDFVAAVKEHNANIVGMSALLTTTMPKMEETVKALEEAGIRDSVKVMAGGAPVNEGYVAKIKADKYAADAAHAVDCAKVLVA